MFEKIYQWLQDISFYMILVTAVTYVLPANSYRKYIRFFTGLVLIMMLLTPVMGLFGMQRPDVEYLMDEYSADYEWNIPDGMTEVNDLESNKTVQIEVEEIVIGP